MIGPDFRYYEQVDYSTHYCRGEKMSQSLTNATDAERKKLSIIRLCIKAAAALAAVAVILVLTIQLSEYPI